MPPSLQTADNVNRNLEVHMANLKVSIFECDYCQEEFVKKINLGKHIKKQHSIQWNCEQCDF